MKKSKKTYYPRASRSPAISPYRTSSIHALQGKFFSGLSFKIYEKLRQPLQYPDLAFDLAVSIMWFDTWR